MTIVKLNVEQNFWHGSGKQKSVKGDGFEL